MNQTFDARFDLNEGSVVGDAHHSAYHAAARGITVRQRLPRIGMKLTHPQGNSFLCAVELQNFNGDFVARAHNFRRMSYAPVRKIADVQQSVDAA